ncbi:hypothetical protein BS47DRAFT_728805 [Hydnum rufescens UP504]|uniref:Uncharacterized protein n=1 Tax=Hydnum rufescens UP504 TaxID=1448309 RepID=A0A9P6DW17_9AGAM|nr:hypothetical protein BS47DRAFT_728805 [Hydnum rufescens UP504]
MSGSLCGPFRESYPSAVISLKNAEMACSEGLARRVASQESLMVHVIAKRVRPQHTTRTRNVILHVAFQITMQAGKKISTRMAKLILKTATQLAESRIKSGEGDLSTLPAPSPSAPLSKGKKKKKTTRPFLGKGTGVVLHRLFQSNICLKALVGLCPLVVALAAGPESTSSDL